MKEQHVETVGLRELSNSLSAYVRKAVLGVRVLISDRGRVIAEIAKVDLSNKGEGHPLLLKWEGAGKLRRGSGRRVKLPRGPELMADRRIDQLLDELRGER